jgi:hypothetical protein
MLLLMMLLLPDMLLHLMRLKWGLGRCLQQRWCLLLLLGHLVVLVKLVCLHLLHLLLLHHLLALQLHLLLLPLHLQLL